MIRWIALILSGVVTGGAMGHLPTLAAQEHSLSNSNRPIVSSSLSNGDLFNLYPETALLHRIEQETSLIVQPDQEEACACNILQALSLIEVLDDQKRRLDDAIIQLEQHMQDVWARVFDELKRTAYDSSSLLGVAAEETASVLVSAAFDMVDVFSLASKAKKGAAASHATEAGVEKGMADLVSKAGTSLDATQALEKLLNTTPNGSLIAGRYPGLFELSRLGGLLLVIKKQRDWNLEIQEKIWAALTRHPVCLKAAHIGMGGCRYRPYTEADAPPGDNYAMASFFHTKVADQLEIPTLAAVDYHDRQQQYVCDLMNALYQMHSIQNITEQNLEQIRETVGTLRESAVFLTKHMQVSKAHDKARFSSYDWPYVVGTFTVSVLIPGGSTAVALGEAISRIGDFLIKEEVYDQYREELRRTKVFLEETKIYADQWGKVRETLPRAKRHLMNKIRKTSLAEQCGQEKVLFEEPNALVGCWMNTLPTRGPLETDRRGTDLNSWHVSRERITHEMTIRPLYGGFVEAKVVPLPGNETTTVLYFDGFFEQERGILELWLRNPRDYLLDQVVALNEDEAAVQEKKMNEARAQDGFLMILRLKFHNGDSQQGWFDVLDGVRLVFDPDVLIRAEDQKPAVFGLRRHVFGVNDVDLSGFNGWIRSCPRLVKEITLWDAEKKNQLESLSIGEPFYVAASIEKGCPTGQDKVLAWLDDADELGDNDLNPFYFFLTHQPQEDAGALISEKIVLPSDSFIRHLPNDGRIKTALRIPVVWGKDPFFKQPLIIHAKTSDSQKNTSQFFDAVPDWDQLGAVVENIEPPDFGPLEPPQEYFVGFDQEGLEAKTYGPDENIPIEPIHPGRFVRAMTHVYKAFGMLWQNAVWTAQQWLEDAQQEVEELCRNALPGSDLCADAQKRFEENKRLYRAALKSSAEIKKVIDRRPFWLFDAIREPFVETTLSRWRNKFIEDERGFRRAVHALHQHPLGETLFPESHLDNLRAALRMILGPSYFP